MLTRAEMKEHVKAHLQHVLIPKDLPMGYVMKIAFLDAIITVIGLGIWFLPAVAGFYPGAFDTMVHVTLGALITILGFFRMALGHLSAWMEIVLIFLGLLVMRLPHFMSMEWNAKYNMGHLAAGGAVVVLAIISGLITAVAGKKYRKV
jgi:hypothetical protein